MFFSEESFTFERELAMNYLEQDMNQTVILYQVDLEKTKINDVYKESAKNEIAFKTPVELTCAYKIDDAQMEAYDSRQSRSVYVKPGKLELWVLDANLEELNADIKRGDFIGVQVTEDKMIFFEVNNDGKVAQFSNAQTMYGTTHWYRHITCNYVDENMFNG